MRGGDTTVLPMHRGRVTRQLWRGSAKARRAKDISWSRPPAAAAPKLLISSRSVAPAAGRRPRSPPQAPAGRRSHRDGVEQPTRRDGGVGAHPAQPHCVTGCAVVAQREPPLLAVRAALRMISSAVGSFGHPPLGLRRYGAGLQPRRGAGWLQAAILLIFASL